MEMTLEQIRDSLKEIDFILEKTPDAVKKLDSDFWIFGALKDLYEMCLDYKQTEFPDMNGAYYVYSKKIVRLLRFVPPAMLDWNKVDTTYFSGVWAALEGVIISPKVMQSYFIPCLNRRRGLDPIRDLGFPDDIVWETIREIPNGYGFALKNTGIVPMCIDTASQWEYLVL